MGIKSIGHKVFKKMKLSLVLIVENFVINTINHYLQVVGQTGINKGKY